MCSLTSQPSLACTTNHFEYQTKLDRHLNRKWQADKPTLFLPLCIAPSVSLVLVKLHSIFRTAAQQGCLCVCLCVCTEFLLFQYFHSALAPVNISTPKIQKKYRAKILESYRDYSNMFQCCRMTDTATRKGTHRAETDKMSYMFLCMCTDFGLCVCLHA